MAVPSIKYEAEPVVFEESYRDGDLPKDVMESEYRALTWILIKIGSVQVIRRDIDRGAVEWPEIRVIIERRDSFIAYIEDQASGYDKVMAWMNQFAKDWASLAVLKSPYTFAAYHTWGLANGGVKSEFDRVIYHFTGFKRSASAKYEAEPVVFEESYRDGDLPKDVMESEYRALTWILIKIGSVQLIRRDIDKGAVEWPEIRVVIERRDSFIAYIEDQASGYDKVMAWMNQFAKDWASLAVLTSLYTFVAYHTWAFFHGGVKTEFDRAIYHFTGIKRSASAK